MAELDGLVGGADIEMEIVDLAARYTTEGTLGKGGMGEVLLATDTRLKRKVAIKRILGEGARSQTALSRFSTEARSIAALNHPNIVQIHDYGRDEDGPFLIMEYIDGGSLLEKCKEGALELEEAVELTCQLCDALSMAHGEGIIHRDIKPANVLLTNDGTPKLTDFGLARQDAGDTGQTMAGAVLGTLDFMPPEQRLDATQTDARSDLWSLAATLYQMLTGEPPRVIDLDEVPQQIRQTLSKALKSKQEYRYQTAQEFRDALRASLTAQEPEPEVAVDLGEGECFRCHTRNSSTRKFCRECAASLRVACLKCEAEIPVWDKVCGECGAKQQELIGQRREAMAQRQEQAMAHLSEFQYDQSRAIANELGDEPDLRFEYLREWSEQFLLEIDTQRTQQLERIEALLSEALQHETATDYQAGIRTLEQTPKILRDTSVPNQSLTAVALLTRLQKKQSEVQRLDRLIKRCVESQKLNGLQKEVDSLLELCPNRDDITELKAQLRTLEETRETAFAEAQRLFEAHDYEGCLPELAKIDSSMLTKRMRELRQQAETKRDRLKTLRQSIDRSVKAKQFGGLLAQVEECLSLQSGAADLQKLQTQLRDRRDKRIQQRDEAYEEAASLLSQGDARGAYRLIGTVKTSDLRSSDEQLRSQLEKIVAAEDKLTALVKESKADGILDPDEVASMWQATGSYLELNPRHEKIAGLQQQLDARIQKSPAARSAIGESNSIRMQFKLLPGGTFTMGEGGGAHKVTLTKPFGLGVYEVTQEQYEKVMGKTPSKFKAPQNPVEQVSWTDAVKFCRKLSALPAEKKAGYVYRLPTEAEWECACRAGTTTTYSFGDSESELGDYGWYDKNSGGTTHPVGGKKPNGWGLYDMHGNVFEWCQDWYGDYPSGSTTDPTGAASGSYRVIRGGCWFINSDYCRSAYRGRGAPGNRSSNLGFRVLRSSIK
jgi:formylglycine-generating enzyme required for sulfatase activity/serine/threonine protein kinase